MEFKNNYKYFFPNWVVVIIGCCIGGFGLIMTVLTQLQSPYFVGILIVGAGIAVFSFAGKMRDADIDEQVDNVRKAVITDSFKEYAFTERQQKFIVISKDFGEYTFPEGQTLHIHRGSDGKYRSSEYTAWSVSIGKDDLYFFSHSVCLTEEKESKAKKTIALDSYTGAKVNEHTYTYKYGKDNSKTAEIKYYTLDISTSDGVTYSLPVHPDVEVDELVARVDHIVRMRRAGQVN